MSAALDYLIAALLLIGGGFALLGSFGLARFGDFYKRLHGPTKATTLGVGCILIGSVLTHSRLQPGLSVHELLITVFLFISAPVSAHLLIKAALHRDRQNPPPPEPRRAGEPPNSGAPPRRAP
jgi:multicomponent K+:H+ antiporter subunit G